MYSAINLNNLDDVSKVLYDGFDINTPDRWGNRVLHFAASMGRMEIVKLLIANGADVTLKTVHPALTAKNLAFSRGYHDVANYLEEIENKI